MDSHVRIPVRRYFNVICRREGRDLPSFRNATGENGVALQDIYGVGGDQVARAPSRELVLARGDGDVLLTSYLGAAGEIVWFHRLLEPERIVLLHQPPKADRIRRGPTVVGVDHQLDFGTDGLTHSPHAFDVHFHRFAADFHFHGAEALGDISLHLLHQLLDALAFFVISARRIHSEPLREDAEHFAHWPVERLPDDVPDGDVNG